MEDGNYGFNKIIERHFSSLAITVEMEAERKEKARQEKKGVIGSKEFTNLESSVKSRREPRNALSCRAVSPRCVQSRRGQGSWLGDNFLRRPSL